ncbi:hypothetical protein [Bradyrhizobium sp. WD16]|uniref:hypothetical protein n=1 Tax=Bradyrhizobium sp. WD16 TaxID=1521768 RepID=UPI0020A4DCC9|nr:hypothetical protein [Bradyrhizobium sp. WD16]
MSQATRRRPRRARMTTPGITSTVTASRPAVNFAPATETSASQAGMTRPTSATQLASW